MPPLMPPPAKPNAQPDRVVVGALDHRQVALRPIDVGFAPAHALAPPPSLVVGD